MAPASPPTRLSRRSKAASDRSTREHPGGGAFASACLAQHEHRANHSPQEGCSVPLTDSMHDQDQASSLVRLRLTHVSKRYGGVVAFKDISFSAPARQGLAQAA